MLIKDLEAASAKSNEDVSGENGQKTEGPGSPNFILIQVYKIKVGEDRRAIGEVSLLVASIKDHGLLHPIIVRKDFETDEWVLVAGAHRLAAVKQLGWNKITAQVVDYDGIKAQLAMIEENIARNDLDVLTRAEQLKLHKELYEQVYKKNSRKGRRPKNDAESAPFSETIAKKTGVAQRTAQEEIQLASDLTDETKDILRGTAMADQKTLLVKLSSLDRELQPKVATKLVNGEAKNLREATTLINKEVQSETPADLPPMDERCRLIHGDCAEEMKLLADDSIDLIPVDPPYGKKYIAIHEFLAKEAFRVLKPGGSLLVMTGQANLHEVFALMTPHIPYRWTIAYIMNGSHAPQWQPKMINGWKPILVFTKGESRGPMAFDVIHGQSEDKRFHKWGQNVNSFAKLIEAFTKPGDTVLDPMVGGGTTGVAALLLNRRFIGIDIDEKVIKTTQQRIADLQVPEPSDAEAAVENSAPENELTPTPSDNEINLPRGDANQSALDQHAPV